MKTVTVIGGGFSGLTTAYFLAREGIPVSLVEKQDRLGGMIDTLKTPQGLVETAASGIRNTGRLEELCKDLDLRLLGTQKESRKRYLFRDGRPRQWPLRVFESAGFAGRLGTHVVTGRFRPKPGETIETWGRRVIGAPATAKILGAALQGIYAGDPAQLSANLILNKGVKPPKPSVKGLVAPPRGLVQLTAAIGEKLANMDVEIKTGTSVDELTDGPTVISTSAHDASRLLKDRAPDASAALGSIEMVPLLRVTAFYPASENTVPGFGTLFPRNEGVRALGVLFNTNIFADRGEGHSESWIYGGARDREILDFDDDALFEVLDRDRAKLYGRSIDAIARYPQRWHVGLPHYDLGLEEMNRKGVTVPDNVFLAGNYLNGIGLPLLLERSWAVSREVKAKLG